MKSTVVRDEVNKQEMKTTRHTLQPGKLLTCLLKSSSRLFFFFFSLKRKKKKAKLKYTR